MWSGSPVRTGQLLRRRSPAKGKHLGMMGTPVWCASQGPGCSGRPRRVGYLGHPGAVGWPSPAPAGAAPVKKCGPGGLSPILDTFPEVGCSEHSLARYAVHPGETVRSGQVFVFSENVVWPGYQHLIPMDGHLLSCPRGTVESGTLWSEQITTSTVLFLFFL
ncbi:hypothetical protein TIFTF001_008791 [Ficus carica]|uniref:Uncharacterized protein n=1 Tax=Ficus carica TaxID=3494 RepID=A0AA87ZU39_FICCA|nr:hypothetical protein TIFTF001_008791 [Ficus carica]